MPPSSDGGVFVFWTNARRVKRIAFAALVAALGLARSAAAQPAAPATSGTNPLGLLPLPSRVAVTDGCSVSPAAILRLIDIAQAPLEHDAIRLVQDRWRALGVRPDRSNPVPTNATLLRGADAGDESYALEVTPTAVNLSAHSHAGIFYAYATLAQLARVTPAGWRVPCVRIDDRPALRWRILSDDVSRGPLPTMRYFEERIRSIAALKMNGYSPYMEHVFADPKHPLPAPLDGITPAELHELAAYAKRFHVAFVPEQQTFAHMHETLKYETYAPLAETPHGYLISPANPAGEAYVKDLIDDELAAVPGAPFFHIGSDEPSDLGKGLAASEVTARGDGPVYADHVAETANYVIAKGGGRPMIWDDALARHPELFSAVPKSLVFVNWHYDGAKTYQPYIDRIAKGGFDQMIAPGALNWNELYPDLDQALTNIGTFVREGKRSHVLGLFQTVWHDDGETLFEATWYPVAFAAASAWQSGDVDRASYGATFAHAFFGSDDPRFVADFADLAACGALVRDNPREYGDYLFWADPLDRTLGPAPVDASALRLAAERVMTHLRFEQPPLHANAARVMDLAARRYDALGRNVQIASESRAYYDAARASLAAGESYALRRLFVTKYLFWEMRDEMLALAPLHARAWEYENRESHEASVLERYRVAADRAIARADAIGDETYTGYVKAKTLRPFDEVLGLR